MCAAAFCTSNTKLKHVVDWSELANIKSNDLDKHCHQAQMTLEIGETKSAYYFQNCLMLI